ncbi:MAG TPA: hypothetical protein VJ839_08190 [Candidatus Limnocylindria bacterium]|nr:hypothetical protein [Candidatus Limnocylindria bacterium]
MDDAAIPALLLALGGLTIVAGVALVRWSGADTRAGRRLAGTRPASLSDLRAAAARDELPRGEVRVEGRVRCSDPIRTADGERLALLHRDVEVEQPDGRWRLIERLRDARTIDLWERSTSVQLDLGQLAEPLITIPHRWEGTPAELDATHQPAVARVSAENRPPRRARAVTRQVMLVDQLIVVAVPGRTTDGALRLDPPSAGFLVATVELDVALRLLAGPHRRRMIAGYAVSAAGLLALAVGIGTLVLAVLG